MKSAVHTAQYDDKQQNYLRLAHGATNQEQAK
jgi:hypothetical protein